MSQVRIGSLGSFVKARAALCNFFKYSSYQIECFLKKWDFRGKLNSNSNAVGSSHSRIISKERKIVQQLGLIRMSLVWRELITGTIIAP